MRIILFLLLLLLILMLIFVSNEILNKKSKAIIFILGLFVAGFVFFYNKFESDHANSRKALLENFLQGKNIKCAQIDVNNTAFNYENGTESFVAKKEFKNLSGVIISIKDCMD